MYKCQPHDVVVVGGGPAGLSAALVLGRARRRVAVIDTGSPRNAPAAHMHGFLSRDGMPPAELLAAGRAEVTGYDVQIIEDRVKAIEFGFQAHLADGQTLGARRILVTTGVGDDLPKGYPPKTSTPSSRSSASSSASKASNRTHPESGCARFSARPYSGVCQQDQPRNVSTEDAWGRFWRELLATASKLYGPGLEGASTESAVLLRWPRESVAEMSPAGRLPPRGSFRSSRWGLIPKGAP